MAPITDYDAIIIAGGRATRLGGIDKTALTVKGRTLLQCALDAVSGAHRVAVVGFGVKIDPHERVSQTSEQPPWSGPAAALAAGMHNLAGHHSSHTVVIAADMPRVAEALALLLDEPTEHDGVIAVDSSGHRQHLLAVYRTDALRSAIEAGGDTTNAALRSVTGTLILREVRVADELCADIDTPWDAAAHGIELRAPALAG